MSETIEHTPETEAVEAEVEAPAEEQAPEQPEKVDGEDALGDKGKKALDAMKAERKKAQEEARELRQELDRLRAEAEGRKAEYEAELKQREAEQAALDKANERILKAEIRAAAAGKLNDPADALLYTDLSSFEVGDDGEVDADAITTAIDDLIKNKPYLAAQGGRKFQGTADGGPRKDALKPTQLSEADVQRLYAEGRHDEIVKAKAEGRLSDYLAS